MTKELRSLKKGETEKLQRALETVERAYGLTDEDIDAFFTLVRHAKEVMAQVDTNTARIESLDRAVNGTAASKMKESTQKMMDWFSRKPEGFR